MQHAHPDILNDQSLLKKPFLTVLALSLWCFFLWQAIKVFGPESDYVYFNSDAAIPVLMANAERPITIFDTYYFGQDRWGAWPLVIARAIQHSTGYRWTDQSLHVVRAIWLFLGLLVIGALYPAARFLVVLLCLIPVCLQRTTTYMLFEIGQVYAWQIPPLLMSWYALRRLFSRDLENQDAKALRLKRVTWCFLLFWSSFFSIWSSTASGPFLVFLFCLEAIRSRLKSTEHPGGKWTKTRYLWGIAPVAAAIVAEILLKTNYHRHGLKHYGHEFKTPMNLDVGFLRENLDAQVGTVMHFFWWPLIVLPALLLIAFACSYVYFSLRANRDALKWLREKLIEDGSVLIVGTLGIAAINFVLIVIVDHVRLNLYGNRYATLTSLFGTISGLLTLFFILRLAMQKVRVSQYGIPAVLCAGVALLMINFPERTESQAYKIQKETATALIQKTPHAILMGGYWETYVFAALAPANTLTPLPLEGDHVRIPWSMGMLQNENHVIVEYRHTNSGRTYSPPQHLIQYANSLRLVEPRFYENGEYAFALYLNETN